MSLMTHGQYDLTQDREVGSRFVLSVIALMVFMGVLALGLCFIMSNMSNSWSAGIENSITVEIPARAPDGGIRTAGDLRIIRAQMIGAIQDAEIIQNIAPIPSQEIKQTLLPWLGSAADFVDLPIPAMIHIEVKNNIAAEDSAIIDDVLKDIAPDVIIDRHETWLRDLSRLTGSLSLVGFGLIALIVATISLAVSGAVRARLASHADEVDLLHLMGAPDKMIIRQFREHVLSLTIRGCVIGFTIGLVTLIAAGLLAGRLDLALSDIRPFSLAQWLGLTLMPLGVVALATMTAKNTVLSVLKKMP